MGDSETNKQQPAGHVCHRDKHCPDIFYFSGFDNTFESETVEGALPRGRNSPRKVPFGLYAEQLSGTAFTRPRHLNQRTWLYRKQPSAAFNKHTFVDTGKFFGKADPAKGTLDPNAMRWMPFETNEEYQDGDSQSDTNFMHGTFLLGASGDPAVKNGIAIYVYLCKTDMSPRDSDTSVTDSYMYNSDGDFLLLPQEGGLEVRTEMGILIVHPGEFCVIPRGIVFSINLLNKGKGKLSRGYMLEVFKGHLTLPELGPIGSNGLANTRDFLYPTAWSENEEKPTCNKTLYNKFSSKLWAKSIETSPFNVVAWHGNYLPYKYDLSKFCAINSVTYDHIDPSIYTVMTCVGDETGTALCDFVIFPPRWMSTDPDTFRPPWFHRNCMTEFMGLIWGGYDAKKGFLPGGASLHSCMTPHGPDAASYDKAVADPCEQPTFFSQGLAFMFETTCMLRLTYYALNHKCRDTEYGFCWDGLPNWFGEGRRNSDDGD
ncbi:homogentisate 1,2-dioxygenase [Nitzschia inconspicua]|uniref:Homogentisate 1,2-dioxygenase n=1 Tax=Nitzschia inconspicua TaxID=303405 RepID=A0A9K3KQX8_9STRA|nr:homogentisate 1,2-dioxygenase [Nitzschia inconspicua]